MIYLKKYLVYIFVILINILLILAQLIWPLKSDVTISYNNENVQPFYILKKDELYSQRFKCDLDDFKELSIKFSTYNVVNTEGIILISLRTNDAEIFSKEVSLAELEDNIIYNLYFDPISDSKNKEFFIDIKYIDYHKNNSLIFWVSCIDDNNMTINNNDSNVRLVFDISGKHNNYSFIYFNVIIILISISMMSIKIGDNNEKK